MTNSLRQLEKVMGHNDSIRADEAAPFLIGKIATMGNRVTINGLPTKESLNCLVPMPARYTVRRSAGNTPAVLKV
jgi:hypothetical protein